MSTEQPSCEVTESGDFPVAPDQLWSLVADFGGLDRIMDVIDSCEVDGDGVGAVRHLAMSNGAVLQERLEALDQEGMTLTYSIIEGPLPFANYRATMTVSGSGSDASTLTWVGRFDPAGVPAADAEQIASGIYRAGIAGFAKALSS